MSRHDDDNRRVETDDEPHTLRAADLLRWSGILFVVLLPFGWAMTVSADDGSPHGVTGTDSVVFVSEGDNGLDKGELAIRSPDGTISGFGVGDDDGNAIRAIGPPVRYHVDQYADVPFVIGGDGEDYTCSFDESADWSYDSTNDTFDFTFECVDNIGDNDLLFDLSYASGSPSFTFDFDTTTYDDSSYDCSTSYDDSDTLDYDMDCDGSTDDDNELDLQFDEKDDGSVKFDFDFDDNDTNNFDLQVDYQDGSFTKIDYESDSAQYDLLTIDIRGTEAPELLVDDVHGNKLNPEGTLAAGHWGGDSDAIDIAFRNGNDGISIIDRTMSSATEIVSDSVSNPDGDTIEPVAIVALGDIDNTSDPEVWWWDGDQGNVVWVRKDATSTVNDAGWPDDDIERNDQLPGIGPPHDFDDNNTLRWPMVEGNNYDGGGVITTDGSSFTLLEDEDKASGAPLTAANVSGDGRKELVFPEGHDINWVNSDFSSADSPQQLTDQNGDHIHIIEDMGVTAATCVAGNGISIFNSYIQSGGVKSRTEAVFTSNLDNETKQGQYRLYSGARVKLADGDFEGILIRENRYCNESLDLSDDDICGSNDSYTCFHRELEDELVDRSNSTSSSQGTDTRRVWTSAPHPSFFDYHEPHRSEPHGEAIGENSAYAFHSAYGPLRSANQDDFGQTYLDDLGGNEDQLVGRRIPFEEVTLRAALSAGQSEPGCSDGTGDACDDAGVEDENDHPFDTNTQMYDYFNVLDPDDSETLDPTTTDSEAWDCNGNDMANCDSRDLMWKVVDEIRGRDDNSIDRVLKGILNSDPVVVDPPREGVPSQSYRAYQARMSHRPSMIYQATHDGQLHAFYTGKVDHDSPERKVRRRVNESPTNAGSPGSPDKTAAAKQREAWSYIPHMLHDELANHYNNKPKLMDGKTTAAEARLCYGKEMYNNNFNACKIHCDGSDPSQPSSYQTSSSTTCVPKEMQWRSVVVQGLGQAGSGYFALDVSRPGGPDKKDTNVGIERPDPIPLWEFTPQWAVSQVDFLHSLDPSLVDDTRAALDGCTQGWRGGGDCEFNENKHYGWDTPNPDNIDGTYEPGITWTPGNGLSGSCTANYEVPHDSVESGNNGDKWETVRDSGENTMMGDSVGSAGIGSVVMPPLDADGSEAPAIRRSIAVFGDGKGGATSIFGGAKNVECDGDAGDVVGRGAIYVVDLQTGSLLRRFAKYEDPEEHLAGGEGPKRFPHDITGSVTMFENGPGKLTTRAFVGGAEGRLYRIDFTDPDPRNWKVSLFYDPNDQEPNLTDAGPVTAPPAVALGRSHTTQNDPVVVYGLGLPGDKVDPSNTYAVMSIKEDYDARNSHTTGELLWEIDADHGLDPTIPEKMLGKPKIFNGYAYFSTYRNQTNSACVEGVSRIWGLQYDAREGEEYNTGDLPPGAFANACGSQNFADCENQWVQPKESSVIQGVSIAPGKNCQFDPTRSGAARFSDDTGSSADSGPQIVANTGGADSGTDSGKLDSGSSDNYINRAEMDAETPSDYTIPMNWSVIDR